MIVEDADWLAGIKGNPGADFAVEVARALINVAEVFPKEITIIATGRGQTRQSLLENRDLRSALLNKIDVSEIEFNDLSLDDLLSTYRDLEAKAGISTAVDAMPQVRRLIEQRRDADKDDFSNAYAVERILDAALKRANQRPSSSGGRILLTRDDFLIPVV